MEEWSGCLKSFNIECHDPIHDTRCTASEAPTWPKARLCISSKDQDIVVLNLEWTPHRRIDSLTLTADGRMPVTELRALFHELRGLGPADTLYPASYRNALPEMAFFSPSTQFGGFVYYETGRDDETGPPLASSLPLSSGSSLQWDTRYGVGNNGANLDVNPHYTQGLEEVLSSQCLVVRYEKDILICEERALGDPDIKLRPTHQWLHAMDNRTYPHPQASHVRPKCSDKGCINYFRRQKDVCDYEGWYDKNNMVWYGFY